MTPIFIRFSNRLQHHSNCHSDIHSAMKLSPVRISTSHFTNLPKFHYLFAVTVSLTSVQIVWFHGIQTKHNQYNCMPNTRTLIKTGIFFNAILKQIRNWLLPVLVIQPVYRENLTGSVLLC